MKSDNIVIMRGGRRLEVREYGDPHGHPLLFFHGLIGSHHQASYIAEQAREHGMRVLAPNRPGVGRSEFTERRSPLEAVADVEDLVGAFRLDEFSLIGISGGAPYVLAALYRLGERVRTTTLISGMGPLQLPGALRGMHRARRLQLLVGARYPGLARRSFRKWAGHFRADPDRFLGRLISTWEASDRKLFERKQVYDLFMCDLHQVFTEAEAAAGLSQQLTLYANYGFSLARLPADRRVTLWQGLDDVVVPPAMAWAMARTIPNCEAHFLPGGHFMAVEAAGQMVARLRQLLDSAPGPAS